MTSDLPPLAVTMGDPAGCGPSISSAAWRALSVNSRNCFYVIGDPSLYQGVPTETITEPSEASEVFAEALPILPLANVPAIEAGRPDEDAAPAIIDSIKLATSHALAGTARGVVTNPINKALLYKAGFKHPGHTEFIADLCTPPGLDTFTPVMMLVGGGLRVALATIHMPLKDVSTWLSITGLEVIALITHQDLETRFGISSPRIAFTGLNPHAGEGGNIGREEIDTINPAAERLRVNGVNISDARPADTVFAEALAGRYDAVIAMTHDQGLIPVKTLDFWGGVNVTLGLPIVRTSPDHGTAYEAAATGTARADSLIAAIRLAGDLSNVDRRAS